MSIVLDIALGNGTQIYDLFNGQLGAAAGGPYSTASVKVHQAGRVVTMREDGLFEERMYLLGVHKSSAQQQNCVTGKRFLDAIGEAVRLYHRDPGTINAYYLKEKAEGESDNRLGLLYDLRIMPSANQGFTYLQNLNQSRFELVIIRGPWESDSARTTLTATNLAAGGKITIAEAGTLPGRIARVKLEPGSGMGTGAAARYAHWMGIRPTYWGISSFDPEWDLSAGTFGADTSQTSGTVTISFATQVAMVPRVTLTLGDIVGSNYNHFIGEYTLVASYLSTGGGSTRFAIQIAGDGVDSDVIYVASTGSVNTLLELGTIRIPSYPIRDQAIDLSDIGIVLSAQLVASTGTLKFTKLYAIPNRHFCYTEGALDSADSTGYVELHMFPEDEPMQVNSDGSVESFGQPRLVNWEVPAEGGVFVYVGGNLDGGIGGGVDVELDIVDRWDGYRA